MAPGTRPFKSRKVHCGRKSLEDWQALIDLRDHHLLERQQQTHESVVSRTNLPMHGNSLTVVGGRPIATVPVDNPPASFSTLILNVTSALVPSLCTCIHCSTVPRAYPLCRFACFSVWAKRPFPPHQFRDVLKSLLGDLSFRFPLPLIPVSCCCDCSGNDTIIRLTWSATVTRRCLEIVRQHHGRFISPQKLTFTSKRQRSESDHQRTIHFAIRHLFATMGQRGTAVSLCVLLLTALRPVSGQNILPTSSSTQFPSCASSCAVLLQIQSTCSTTGNSLANENCFCQSSTIQPLYSTPDALCTAECTTESDRVLLRTWFLQFCQQVGAGIDPNAQTTTGTQQATGSVTVVTITSTNTSPPGSSNTGTGAAAAPAGRGSQSWYDRNK
jgi:hypothetical protein